MGCGTEQEPPDDPAPDEVRELIDNAIPGGIANLMVPATDAEIPVPPAPAGYAGRFDTTEAKRYLGKLIFHDPVQHTSPTNPFDPNRLVKPSTSELMTAPQELMGPAPDERSTIAHDWGRRSAVDPLQAAARTMGSATHAGRAKSHDLRNLRRS